MKPDSYQTNPGELSFSGDAESKNVVLLTGTAVAPGSNESQYLMLHRYMTTSGRSFTAYVPQSLLLDQREAKAVVQKSLGMLVSFLA